MTQDQTQPQDQPNIGFGSAPQAAQGAGYDAIPYTQVHDGSRRIIWITIQGASTILNGSPVVGVDGNDYWVRWGDIPFEVPADRPVHLSMRVVGPQNAAVRVASMLLRPQDDPYITYDAGASFRGASIS